ncbi:MAG TPA: SNF2-related protein, partial [Gemmatimonadaceae bacterium]|nr:SNF2-related protein [Gemmatimonadaceae bacterium]
MARPLIVPWRLEAPGVVRARIAAAWLGAGAAAGRIGRIELLPHQRAALDRLRRLLRERGGALLADDVGLGKTYVAAALVREHRRPLVVAPAALRAMWRDALRDVDAAAEVTSYSALSRGRVPTGPFDLVVLDEAHHARTPSTRRYAALAALVRRARVLLLSATPVHNAARDLAALFALFLGAAAWSMDGGALARLIVRRVRADVPHAGIPEAAPPHWLSVGDDEALLRAILALPPPVPPS